MSSTLGIFRGECRRIKVKPTAALPCGTFVLVGGLVGVTTSAIAANTEGEIQIDGDYEIAIASASAAAGSLIKTTVSTLGGSDVAGVPVGIALETISSGTALRIKLIPNYLAFLEPYKATSVYAVGDLCLYNNKAYVCKTAIASAEAWTSGHWTELGALATVVTTPAS